MDFPPASIAIVLCPDCTHGRNCRKMQIVDTAFGGITCLGFNLRRSGKPLPAPHIMALPDREPCADCACRKGSQPNGTHHSMVAFQAALDNQQPFLCHENGANRICAGWLRAMKARL